MKSIQSFQHIDYERLSVAMFLAKRDVNKLCLNIKLPNGKTQIPFVKFAPNISVVGKPHNKQKDINSKQTNYSNLASVKHKSSNHNLFHFENRAHSLLSCNSSLGSLSTLPAQTDSPPVRDIDFWKPNRTRRRALHEPTEKQLKNAEESHMRQLRAKMTQYSMALMELEQEKRSNALHGKCLPLNDNYLKTTKKRLPTGLGLLKNRLNCLNLSTIRSRPVPLEMKKTKRGGYHGKDGQIDPHLQTFLHNAIKSLDTPIGCESESSLSCQVDVRKDNENVNPMSIPKEKSVGNNQSYECKTLNSEMTEKSVQLEQMLHKFLRQIDEAEKEENVIRERWRSLKLVEPMSISGRSSVRIVDTHISPNVVSSKNHETATFCSNPNASTVSFKNEMTERPSIMFSKPKLSQSSEDNHCGVVQSALSPLPNRQLPTTTLTLPIRMHQNVLRLCEKQSVLNHQTHWSNLGIQSTWISTSMASVLEEIVNDMLDEMIDSVYLKFDDLASNIANELICSELAPNQSPDLLELMNINSGGVSSQKPHLNEFIEVAMEPTVTDGAGSANCKKLEVQQSCSKQLPEMQPKGEDTACSEKLSILPSLLSNIRSLESLEKSCPFFPNNYDGNYSASDHTLGVSVSDLVNDDGNVEEETVIQSNDEYTLEFEKISTASDDDHDDDQLYELKDESITTSNF